MIRSRIRRLLGATLLAAFSALFLTEARAQDAGPSLEARLERLTEEFERQRQELHIPGLALAVVQGDELIYSHGFGSADLENGKPVTPETLFAIGSSTKAFTATLIGMLVDEGRMDWDDPVTKYLSYFEWKIDAEDPDAVVTIRDLLSHRTGFTRMGILWAGGAVPREEVLRIASKAEPWAPYRKAFFYNNIAFLAAGMASATVAGSSWDDLLAKRLLGPLGMKDSNSSVSAARNDPRLSRGYIWREEIGEYMHLPMRSLDTIAPAGAINSNVLDMAQWLRFQLGRGQFDGRVLLSAERHDETWSKQMPMGPGADYGLGWMLRSVAGHRLVEHGGNIDGFGAQVSLFPEDDLGFVLLTNVTSTPLQGTASKLVFDALLAEWPEEGESVAAVGDLEVYAGKYVANFASFEDDRFTVVVKESRLAIDVPNQMLYDLEPPDDEGKWYFSLTDQIAVSFDREGDGPVVGLRMHQGGMTFELPREGVELVAEIDLDSLRPYLGKYHLAEKKLDFEVLIANQRLAVDVPGEMVFELHPPDEDGKWVFRVTDKLAVWFSEPEDGTVKTMKLFQNGVEKRVMQRAEAQGETRLPTVQELLALRPGADGSGSFRITGRIRFVNAGLEGKLTITSDGLGRFHSDSDFGRFGWIQEAVDGEQGWVNSNLRPFRELKGKYLLQARVARALIEPDQWPRIFDSMTVTGSQTRDGTKAYRIQLRAGELPAIKAFLDGATGDLLGYEMNVLDADLGIGLKTKTRMEDYREVDGVRVAFRTVSRNVFAGETVFELDRFETGIAIDESLFASPEEE